MTKATQKGYAQLWESELKNKCLSETAGEMASLMHGFLASGIEYPGRAGHIKKVVSYLQRTTRLKYRRVDIERVCEFLGRFPDKIALLEKIGQARRQATPAVGPAQFPGRIARDGKGLFGFGGPRREITWRQPESWRKPRATPKETRDALPDRARA